jgi:anti-anti-sigma factor
MCGRRRKVVRAAPGRIGDSGNNMKLSLVSIDPAGFVRVAADGTITAADFPPEARNPLEAILGSNWSSQRALVSWNTVSFVDSSAIGWLIETNKQFKAAGGRLVIHSIKPKVRQVLDLLRVGKAVLLAAPDVRRALRRLCEGAFPDVAVLTYGELDASLQIRPIGKLASAR